MYDMHQNRLPAPYELNQPVYATQSPMYSSLARGGRARNKGFEVVHMNPHEISILDHLQGKTENKNGVRSFSHIEELLKNPHILQNVHHHARQHHAEGGYADGGLTHEDVESLRHHGRFGDSTLANIGPHTQHFLNFLAGGHPTINPYTGHPEYWSIGGALGGLGGALKGMIRRAPGALRAAAPHLKNIASTVLPSVLPAAQQYLGDKFGSIGQSAGKYLGNAATNALAPQEGAPVSPYTQAFGNAINRGIEARRGGASAGQSFGQGLEAGGSHLGGGLGGALSGMGSSIGAGNSARNVLRSGAQSGFNAMGGVGGLKSVASNVAKGFGSGGLGGVRTAAKEQFNDYRNRAMPQLPPPANIDYGQPYPEEMEQYA